MTIEVADQRPGNIEISAPLISVIMPVYNSAAYLREAIDSILNQTFTNFEFLIFNDGSTDESKTIIESYVDNRIRFFDDAANQGYTPRLNAGLDNARGKYIARMDSDDIALPTRFEKQYHFLEQHPEVALCGTFFEFIGEGALSDFNWVKFHNPDLVKINLLFDGAICHPSVMLRASALEDAALHYDPAFEPSEDFELWIRMSGRLLLANIPEVLLQYRVNSNQVSSRKNELQRQNKFKLVARQLDALKIVPTPRDLRVHDHMFYPSPILSADYLPKVKTWIKKLIDANQQYHVYPPEKFEVFLNDLYLQNQLQFEEKVRALPLKQRLFYQVKWALNWKSIK